jgi:DNA-binding response OmpR family regulator
MEINRNVTHILVVDDEPEIHAVLGKLLVKQGYNVESAYNADEAYAAIAARKPDLIILDIMMPRISGIEVCNRLKSDPVTKDILILIVSARDEQADRIKGLSHGADDYVSKPFHLQSLVRKIEHMLGKKQVSDFNSEIGR